MWRSAASNSHTRTSASIRTIGSSPPGTGTSRPAPGSGPPTVTTGQPREAAHSITSASHPEPRRSTSPRPGSFDRYTSTCDQSPVSQASARIRGTSRSISADCSAEPIRSAGASTWIARRPTSSAAAPSHSPVVLMRPAEASAAAATRRASIPLIMSRSASVFVYVRQATPLTSSPACSSRHVSTSEASALCGRLVMPTTVLVPRCLRAAAMVSREPPPAEIATTKSPSSGGCGAPVEACSA